MIGVGLGLALSGFGFVALLVLLCGEIVLALVVSCAVVVLFARWLAAIALRRFLARVSP